MIYPDTTEYRGREEETSMHARCQLPCVREYHYRSCEIDIIET